MGAQDQIVGFGVEKNKIGLNVVSLALFAGVTAALSAFAWMFTASVEARLPALLVALAVAASLAMSVRLADQWERAVILRLGKYQELKGPGLFWVIPFVDRVTMWLDSRVRAT